MLIENDWLYDKYSIILMLLHPNVICKKLTLLVRTIFTNELRYYFDHIYLLTLNWKVRIEIQKWDNKIILIQPTLLVMISTVMMLSFQLSFIWCKFCWYFDSEIY